MLIQPIAFKQDVHAGVPGWVARVVYEDGSFIPPPLVIASTTLDPHRPPTEFMLLALAVGALTVGERRIGVLGDLDSGLFENLPIALAFLNKHVIFAPTLPVIEVAGKCAPCLTTGRGAGLLLSGGVDSTALLVRLLTWFPPEHPNRLRDAYFIHGFDIGISETATLSDYYHRSANRLQQVCEARDITLHRVYTNLRDPRFAPCSWPDAHYGMAAIGIGHAFSHRINDLYMAGGIYAPDLFPQGSHPQLDPYCGSTVLTVHHAMADMRRVDRVRLIAQFPDLLPGIRVCWSNVTNDGPPNCGHCHKCVLTMLELLANGALPHCSAFPDDDVSADLVMKNIRESTLSSISFVSELIDEFEKQNRMDLVQALSYKRKRIFENQNPWARFARKIQAAVRSRRSRA